MGCMVIGMCNPLFSSSKILFLQIFPEVFCSKEMLMCMAGYGCT